MTIELHPVDVACNLSCPYCYQHGLRDASGNSKGAYDMSAMKEALEREGGAFTLFGGEALLFDIDDLEELWRFGYERFGRNSIQTNGTLISDRHLSLIQTYKVHVGMSVDGPGALNDTRWAGSLEKTREMTRRSMDAIVRLTETDCSCSLIVTLHRKNAVGERLEILKEWFRWCARAGIGSSRLHSLEVDHRAVGYTLALTVEEQLRAFDELHELGKELPFDFDVFRDVDNLLLGDDERATCIWTGCDPYTTEAVRGVDGDGRQINCGRASKDGNNWTKADRRGHERQLALYQTEQKHGGCKGCRFWLMCKGECPGGGIDMDWRNRSDSCLVWKGLFAAGEERLVASGKTPVSFSEDREAIEKIMLAKWMRGERTNIARSIRQLKSGVECGPTRVGEHHTNTPHRDFTDHVNRGTPSGGGPPPPSGGYVKLGVAARGRVS